MSDTVTIPKVEYDRLCGLAEDLADIEAARFVLDRLEGGAEELVPAAVADRLIDGGNPLKVWRQYRGMSQSELARVSGASRVQVVDIESGRATGSVHTLRRLADALRIGLDDLAPA